MDVKFCSDPNSFNCGKKGVLPVTLFGSADFDVTEVDTDTVQLCTDLTWGDGGCVDLHHYTYEDRGDPTTDLGADQCACLCPEGDPVDGICPDGSICEEQRYLSPDTILDLELAFYAPEVSEMIGCDGLERKEASDPLIVIGYLSDGTFFTTTPIYHVGIDQLTIR